MPAHPPAAGYTRPDPLRGPSAELLAYLVGADLSKHAARLLFRTLLDLIISEVAAGRTITIEGLGTFAPHENLRQIYPTHDPVHLVTGTTGPRYPHDVRFTVSTKFVLP